MAINGPDAQTQFAAAASDQTRAKARETLNELVNHYLTQSAILEKTMKGETRFTRASDDQNMAREISTQLDRLGLQIQLATLVCARLDGVDVGGLITEVKNIISERSPDIRKPGPWG